MGVFVLLGIMGGALGALFIKATRIWALTFRRIPILKRYPGLEVLLVALCTGVVSELNIESAFPFPRLKYHKVGFQTSYSLVNANLSCYLVTYL
jgi:chloride channel 3/4/5